MDGSNGFVFSTMINKINCCLDCRDLIPTIYECENMSHKIHNGVNSRGKRVFS